MRSFLDIVKQEDTLPTFNGFGYSYNGLVGCSKKFVDYAAQKKGVVLDIGSGRNWHLILSCVEAGCTVYANDIDNQNISAILEHIPLELQDKVVKSLGKIQDLDFKNDYFDAINASGVIHYFSEEDMLRTIRKMHDWLKEGGQLFFQTTSIYSSLFKGFDVKYKERKLRGESIPGLVDVKGYIKDFESFMPRFIRLFTKEEAEEIFQSFGFKVEESSYLEDRGLVSLILKK